MSVMSVLLLSSQWATFVTREDIWTWKF